MATNSNVFSQGSGGSTYENEVQTTFLISFILGLHIPGANGTINYYRLQSGSLGYQTDDLLLKLSAEGRQTRILIQIKHNLTISEKGEEFGKVISAAFLDFLSTELFDPANDKIFIIKHGLTSAERNHLKVLLDWSRAKTQVNDFFQEVQRIQAKNHYLMMFKLILTAAFPTEYTDERLFRFFKTLYIFEFDLGTDNSVIKAGYLSLINRYKTNDQLSAEQIWDNLKNYVSDADPKGGQLDIEVMPDQFVDIFYKSNLQTALKNLKTLSNQNLETIEMISDEIGGFNLSRPDKVENIGELLNSNRILMISGDPGSGKSAVAKAYIKKVSSQLDGFILCFNAEELSNGHLRDYFNRYNIDLTLKELFGFFSQFTQNLIYIDATEKLLEANGTPLTELISSLKLISNVRLIISCRSSSIGLIELKYFGGIPPTKLPLAPFADTELEELIEHLPQLSKLMQNQRLKKLLVYPKYLDFAYKALIHTQQDFSEIDEEKFREQLWLIIIENKLNEYQNGLPQRRGQLFIDVAVARSRQMRRYATILSTDHEAIEKLLKDHVLIRSGEQELYAPAHDVLEDWALVRFVQHLYGQQLQPDVFFEKLGKEPAMRRAYRLWVQSYLKPQANGPLIFATDYLFESGGENFWKDESLIGILYSEESELFFDRFAEKLKKDNFISLFHLIQVMRTACRENLGDFYQKNYVPRGFGWKPVFRIVRENIASIEREYYDLIYQIVSDWSTIIKIQEDLPAETRDAGLILLYLIQHHIEVESRIDNKADQAIQLLCELSGGIIPELQQIILENDPEEEQDDDDNDENFWYSDRLRARVIKAALNGPHSRQLAKYLPEELLNLARRHWMLTTEKVHYSENAQDSFLISMSRHSSMDFNHHFGLKNEHNLNYSPASAYQTPILSLLTYHPKETIDFIIELVNWCTDNYRYSDFSKDDEGINIRLELEDGTIVEQFGNSYLWSIFRSTQKVSPNLLQSTLMALERFLMDELRKGGDAILLANQILDRLYKKSRSVATTGVIASVCQAFPDATGKQIIPLLSTRKIISWDVQRYSRDRIHSHFSFFEPYFDNERKESDKLPHRLRYYGGLRGFFPLYCYEHGIYNERIYTIIDRHRKEAAPEDFEWKKILDELDLRTWKVTNRLETKDTISLQIEPSYDESIKDFVSDLRKEADAKNENDAHRNWLWRVKKEEVAPNLEDWRNVYRYYQQIEQYNFLEHQPGKVAEIGVINFWGDFDQDERNWCLQIIVNIFQTKIHQAYEHFRTDIEISTLDFEAALNAFPFLLGRNDLPDREDLEILALQFLTSPFQENDPDTMHFFLSIGNNLWKTNEGLAARLLNGLLFFAAFSKTNRLPNFRNNTDQEKEAYWENYEQLLITGIKDGYKVNIDKINFENYSIFFISRAIRILPITSENELSYKIIIKAYHLYLPLLIIEERRRNRDENQDFAHYLGSLLKDRISKMILWNDNSFGKSLFIDLLTEGQRVVRSLAENSSRKLLEVARFFRDTIEGIILEADRNLPETDAVSSQKTADNFTAAWRVFGAFMIKPDSILIFADHLLLDIDVHWKVDVANWRPLSADVKFYQAILRTFGPTRMDSTIVFLSHIGDELFLLQNLKWLISLLKNPKIGSDVNKYKSLEQLVIRVYQNHLSELLADRTLFDEYLWLLDNLVTQQSSDAYWIREFIISFK